MDLVMASPRPATGNGRGMCIRGAEEGGEGLVHLFLVHANPGVGYLAAELVPCGIDRDGDPATAGRVFDGVRDQVVDGLAEPFGVEVARGGSMGE